jgi:RHH-type proline utilization regulon transcriptional repressor/proline dehydrogenase/delta 1-pyrroline-5-carboxylate dehydrogenase
MPRREKGLEPHPARMEREARLLYRCTLPPGTEHGTFFAPRAYEIDNAELLSGEVFGPILHIVR